MKIRAGRWIAGPENGVQVVMPPVSRVEFNADTVEEQGGLHVFLYGGEYTAAIPKTWFFFLRVAFPETSPFEEEGSK